MKKLKVGSLDFSKKYLCMECGCQREPIYVKRGLLVIEILMWLCYLFPGVIYSIWRRVRKQQVCPKCLTPSVELTSSTRAMGMMRLMREMANRPLPDQIPTKAAPSRKPGSSSGTPSKAKDKDLNAILKNSRRRGLKSKGQQGIVNFKPPGDK
ncbi:MAG: hypothetical protein GWM98_03090 [Nitrospinaceae bacterium]|nr:YqaE/Pmp3 family membrane protein [Nitrospinaceae bacterium]NIR53677.1 YqaE/Pmp3 family membrane protein [Nitrospinaceae bacterium]NIS84084.1 YqaE/Pmp3 family membrane protein [Nitrospinaceae bacterium]NIT80888.1 YqaE/Pmp3 family membrane protein [Nitrospinaceae bacterium]NIU43187.1 YqaE/Pmp3 family membrane protein [Nitrospinaceae bacterium]